MPGSVTVDVRAHANKILAAKKREEKLSATSFEVASIRLSGPNQMTQSNWNLPNGLSANGTSLAMPIVMTYLSPSEWFTRWATIKLLACRLGPGVSATTWMLRSLILMCQVGNTKDQRRRYSRLCCRTCERSAVVWWCTTLRRKSQPMRSWWEDTERRCSGHNCIKSASKQHPST